MKIATTMTYEECVKENHEIGFVEQVYPSLAYVKGLPSVHPFECVVFESGEVGQVLSMNEDHVEVMLFSGDEMKVGTSVGRTNKFLEVLCSTSVLGKIVDPLGKSLVDGGKEVISSDAEAKQIDVVPKGMRERAYTKLPFATGVSVVDLVVPLARGQRELVIGDRKTGKSAFVFQVVLNLALEGNVCVYAAIGKRKTDVEKIINFFRENGVLDKIILVVSTASDLPGMIFLTPYTAMTYAEYFREQGKDVFVIFDDMTAHAQYYREVALIARHFPGRSSYPGDIFYIHSRLLERAGVFEKGTITCLPVVETVLSDLAGFIQTNLMSITDGHIFFDVELFNQGRRPAVNPYLSVTRMGEQVQTPLVRDLGRNLSRFLVYHQRLSELVHFGSEFEERVKKDLALGNRIFIFFDQDYESLRSLNVSIFFVAGLWLTYWNKVEDAQIGKKVIEISEKYVMNKSFRDRVDGAIVKSKTFSELLSLYRDQEDLFE